MMSGFVNFQIFRISHKLGTSPAIFLWVVEYCPSAEGRLAFRFFQQNPSWISAISLDLLEMPVPSTAGVFVLLAVSSRICGQVVELVARFKTYPREL